MKKRSEFNFCLAFGILSFAFAQGVQADYHQNDEIIGDDTSVTYSGQAAAFRATVLGLPLAVSDTGALPSQGGALEASLLDIALPLPGAGNLVAQVFHATSIGQGKQSSSEASLANLDLTLGLNAIKADFLMSRAAVSCTKSMLSASHIAGLNINGKAVVITGQPNQVINLIAGSIIINEQIKISSNNSSSVTVNALHIKINGLADVVISSAHADMSCTINPPCGSQDFVTGGGYITTGTNKKSNFAVAGGIKNNAGWGHLTYIDHGTGMKVHGTGVTSYEIINKTTRRIKGTAKLDNNTNITYTATVSDAGEPGINDTFRLQLSNGYDTATRLLSGGNIQLHKPCN